MKNLFFCFITILLSLHSFADSKDTLSVYFDIGVPVLDEVATHKLDSLLYNDIIYTGKKVGIIGYADYLGTETSNLTLSENRANNVKEYLVHMGIREPDIELVMGKGEIDRTVKNGSTGYREDRRVDIIPGGFKPSRPTSSKNDSIPKKSKPIINLSEIKENETIRLDRMHFLPGRHFLREESMVELLKLQKIMVDNPTLKIAIEGHICCLRTNATDGYDYDTEEFTLSLNRAKYIYEYLIYKGINKNRMSYKGFGRTKPLVDPERTLEDENMNRRVEIRIISK